MHNELRPKWLFGFSSALVAVVLLWGSVAAAATAANPKSPATGAYQLLVDKAALIESGNHVSGWSYIVSGGIALGVSIPAYYLSEDVFSRAIYGLTQTLGVAAVGYGTYLVTVDSDYTRFVRMLEKTPSLSTEERNRLADLFLIENAERARMVRRTRMITHGLTAGLNISNGLTTSNSELRTALLFLGGINLLATAKFAFSTSEEEDLARSAGSANVALGADSQGRPSVALQIPLGTR